jgi:hypothetical protein
MSLVKDLFGQSFDELNGRKSPLLKSIADSKVTNLSDSSYTYHIIFEDEQDVIYCYTNIVAYTTFHVKTTLKFSYNRVGAYGKKINGKMVYLFRD